MQWLENIGGLGPTPRHHLGGRKATRRLIEMADLNDNQKVLVPGCGNGETAIAIATLYNCQVTGTDINPAAISEADKNLGRIKKNLKGKLSFRIDDLLNSRIPDNSYDRVVVESVLIMLPKDQALNSIQSLLASEGLLAINEGLRRSGDLSSLANIEKEFKKIGINWSLPSYEEWNNYFERNNFTVISDSSPIPYRITLLGLESFLRSPVNNTKRFVRMLFNPDARGFFARVMFLLVKTQVRWGYGIWICKKNDNRKGVANQ